MTLLNGVRKNWLGIVYGDFSVSYIALETVSLLSLLMPQLKIILKPATIQI